jgi:hypothetical protein
MAMIKTDSLAPSNLKSNKCPGVVVCIDLDPRNFIDVGRLAEPTRCGREEKGVVAAHN